MHVRFSFKTMPFDTNLTCVDLIAIYLLFFIYIFKEYSKM